MPGIALKALFAAAFAAASPLFAAADSPYGVCAHISRGEFSVAPKELDLMRQAGIGWVRCDFDWKNVEKEQGKWDYSRLDQVVALAESKGATILPILDYDVPWATPAYKNLDKWREYVRNTVTRYKDRLRYWEVWNEENLAGMWKERPDGASYAALVKASYEEIKSIDPELQVVLGGTAGIPMDFIEKFLEAGGGAYVDVVNIHPYRYPDTPEAVSLYHDVLKLDALLKKYGVSKDIWITEIGWPTHKGASDVANLIKGGLDALSCPLEGLKVAAVVDPSWGFGEMNFFASVKTYFPYASAVEAITVEQLKTLSPKDFKVLMLPSEESFPMASFQELERYVAEGGVVVFSKGVPLYYDLRRDAAGVVSKVKVGDEYRQRLHIGWEAWWTKPGLPHQTDKVAVAAPFEGKLKIADLPCETFFTDSELKPGDALIPLVYGVKDSYKGVAAAAYKLGSSKGGGVVAVSFRAIGGGVSELTQAEMLPRAYLLAFQAGVKRVFWYELQSPGGPLYDREAHFGLLQKDLSKKPGFEALAQLIKMRPAGSNEQAMEARKDGVYLLSWKRPDGVKAYALWSAFGKEIPCVLKIDGSIASASGFLGQPEDLKPVAGRLALTAKAGILYFSGPRNVKFELNH